MWGQLAVTGINALGSAAGAPAAPAVSSSDGNNVNVGGLNVPAFPNFPAGFMSSGGGGVSVVNNNRTLIYAALALLTVIMVKKLT